MKDSFYLHVFWDYCTVDHVSCSLIMLHIPTPFLSTFFLFFLPVLERIYCVVAQEKCFPFSANWCISHGYYYIPWVVMGFCKSCSCIVKDSMLYAANSLVCINTVLSCEDCLWMSYQRPMILCHEKKKIHCPIKPDPFQAPVTYFISDRRQDISTHFKCTWLAITSLYMNQHSFLSLYSRTFHQVNKI